MRDPTLFSHQLHILAQMNRNAHPLAACNTTECTPYVALTTSLGPTLHPYLPQLLSLSLSPLS